MKFYQRLLLDAARGVIERAAQSRERHARVEDIVAAAANRKRPPRRRPPESGIMVPAIPPRGPLPMPGGAEAPLDFEADGPPL